MDRIRRFNLHRSLQSFLRLNCTVLWLHFTREALRCLFFPIFQWNLAVDSLFSLSESLRCDHTPITILIWTFCEMSLFFCCCWVPCFLSNPRENLMTEGQHCID